MLRLNVFKLISKELKDFARATGFSIPTCYVVRSFVCKDLSPHWFRVVFQFYYWHIGTMEATSENQISMVSASLGKVFNFLGVYFKWKLSKGAPLHITKTPLFKYIENITTKNWKFSDKKSDIFHISAQNIDCGYSLEPPRRGGSNEYPQSLFLSRYKKNNVYPCKPQFYYIKVGFKGSKLYRYVFVVDLFVFTAAGVN